MSIVIHKTRSLLWIGALSFGLVLLACGDDDEFTDNGIGSGNNQLVDTSVGDTGADADSSTFDDTGADGGSPDAADEDTGNVRPRIEVCGGTDLGEIGADQSTSGTAASPTAREDIELSCSADPRAPVVFSFSLERASRVSLTASSPGISDFNLQFNQGPCDSAERFVCFNRGSEVVFLDAGVDYHVLVEPGSDRSTPIKLDIATEVLECFPSGSTRCVGDEVEVCGSGFTPTTHSCAIGCSNDACTGDTCESAIPMDPSGSMRLEGSPSGFRDMYNFGSRDECFESGFSIDSGGPDVAVALDGLSAGQVVSVDASREVGDVNDNTIFIVDGCADTPTCVAGDDAEQFDWEVPADGDYVLIIDLVSVSDDSFVYQIDIEDPNE